MKIRCVELVNGNNIEERFSVEAKPTKTLNSFDLIRRTLLDHDNEIGGKLVSSGITTLYGGDGYKSSYYQSKDNSGYERHNEFCLSPCQNGKDEFHFETPSVVLQGDEKREVFLGVDLYEVGYVLKTGAQGVNIFGTPHSCYFTKITTRNIKSGSKSGAKVFPTLKALITYLNKYNQVLQYAVSHYGWELSYETASSIFDQEFRSLSEKERKKYEAGKDVLDSMIEALNQSVVKDTKTPVFGNTPEEEARLRMDSFHLLDAVKKRFDKDAPIEERLFMSEAGGILYDLDDTAKEYLEDFMKCGFGLPYHIIKSGTMYAFLYVSNYSEEWEYERMDKDGIIISAVYSNMTYGTAEIGSIRVVPANGGISRIG